MRAKEENNPEVVMWGTGSPMREFLHVDDLADACLYLLENYDGKEFVNVGTGTDITIKDLALLIKGIVGYEGELVHDLSKPDGTRESLWMFLAYTLWVGNIVLSWKKAYVWFMMTL